MRVCRIERVGRCGGEREGEGVCVCVCVCLCVYCVYVCVCRCVYVHMGGGVILNPPSLLSLCFILD